LLLLLLLLLLKLLLQLERRRGARRTQAGSALQQLQLPLHGGVLRKRRGQLALHSSAAIHHVWHRYAAPRGHPSCATRRRGRGCCPNARRTVRPARQARTAVQSAAAATTAAAGPPMAPERQVVAQRRRADQLARARAAEVPLLLPRVHGDLPVGAHGVDRGLGSVEVDPSSLQVEAGQCGADCALRGIHVSGRLGAERHTRPCAGGRRGLQLRFRLLGGRGGRGAGGCAVHRGQALQHEKRGRGRHGVAASAGGNSGAE
jgi:hypothetical protein